MRWALLALALVACSREPVREFDCGMCGCGCTEDGCVKVESCGFEPQP